MHPLLEKLRRAPVEVSVGNALREPGYFQRLADSAEALQELNAAVERGGQDASWAITVIPMLAQDDRCRKALVQAKAMRSLLKLMGTSD